MTHLNIQQGLNIEVVSTNLIKKLYEAALSVPEPLEGELDAAYMSGNLLVDKSYRALVEYLTNRFNNLHINVTGDYYIEFEDPLVLSVLLANNFSSDGVGITESDAASAYLLTKFANNSNITTFNEFKYFTSVNKTDTGSAQTFINCTNLSEIDLTEWEVALLRLFENTAITTVNAPKLSRYGSGWGAAGVFQTNSHLTTVQSLGHVTKIVQLMFGGCINLETVNLPQECTTIEKLAFIISYNQGGGHLATINLDNITTIGDSAFQELRRLAKTLPTDMPNLTSIGNNAFENCVGLTGSVDYQNLTSLGLGAFKGCTGITSVLNLGLVSEIGDPFWNCTSITEIVLPTTLRKSSSFYNTHISKLIYPYGFTEKISGLMCGGELGRYLLYILFPSTVTKIVCDDMYRDSGNSRIRCHIVVLATTPPNTNRNPSDTSGSGLGWSWGDPSQANWYVPDAVVNTYKTDTQWSSIADYIFPISQLEADSPTCWSWYQVNKDYGVPTQS